MLSSQRVPDEADSRQAERRSVQGAHGGANVGDVVPETGEEEPLAATVPVAIVVEPKHRDAVRSRPFGAQDIAGELLVIEVVAVPHAAM